MVTKIVTDVVWERARRPERKQLRRDSFLAASAELLGTRHFDDVSIQDVAARAGVSKGNLYRYFASKEELFLALYELELGRWLAEVETRLARRAACLSPDEVANGLVDAVLTRPLLCKLTALLSGVLERNASVDVVRAFKQGVAAGIDQLARVLTPQSTGLGRDDVVELMHFLHAVVAGFWPMAHPPPVLDDVLAQPSLSHLRVTFDDVLRRAVVMHVRGLSGQSKVF